MTAQPTPARATSTPPASGSLPPLPVQVIRPRLTARETTVRIISAVLVLALRAWVVMLLVPHIIDEHPSFWASGAACLVVGSLIGNVDEYRYWTTEAKR